MIPSRHPGALEQKNRSAFADRFLAKLSSNSLETSLALPPEASGAACGSAVAEVCAKLIGTAQVTDDDEMSLSIRQMQARNRLPKHSGNVELRARFSHREKKC